MHHLDRFEYVLVSLSKVMVPISEVNNALVFLLVGSTNSTIRNWWGLKYMKVWVLWGQQTYGFYDVNKLGNCNSWGQSNTMDGVRLTDAQKYRLTSQNKVCHSKKRFWELPQVLRRANLFLFCEDTGTHVVGEVFGLLWSPLGSMDELFSLMMVF